MFLLSPIGWESKKCLIPEENERLKSLSQINKALCHFVHKKSPINSVTLDMNATLIETNQRTAKYCYKGFASYQPLNVWWPEQKMMLHSEFRNVNIPAGFEQLRVFKDAIKLLPDEITKIDLRSDSAAYQWELLRYCERKEKEHPNLDIEFAVGI